MTEKAEAFEADNELEESLLPAVFPARSSLARFHLGIGAIALTAFLTSGIYMRTRDPAIHDLDPGMHLMFTSRHIYILAAALIHLLLGTYVRSAKRRPAMVTQWIGSIVLTLSAALLIIAFLNEPMLNRYRTPFSSFGIYTLFLGSALHVGTGLWSRSA